MKYSSLYLVALALLSTFLLNSCKVNDYSSTSQPVTHNIWDSLLRKHVSPEGWVDYAGFIQDSSRLNRYLELLEGHHPNEKNWSRDERLAYWINAYNAYTVKLITKHYPVESIKDIKSGIPFVNTVWDIKFIHIEGATYDLNNLEHGIIRPRFKEPRTHFALNCAAVSCPKLQNRAYTADKLDEQLTNAAEEFLANENKNKLSEDKVQLSKIFSWYRGDFLDEADSIIGYINRYAPIEVSADAEIEYLDYSWALNGLSNKPEGATVGSRQ